MIKKLQKLSLVFGVIALGLLIAPVNSASAVLTLGATSVTTDGDLTFTTVAGSAVTMFAANTTGAITIGGTAQTGAVSLGASTGALTLNLATGATGIKTINIGTGATANVIAIGTGNAVQTVNIASHATPANVISIGGAASTTTIGSVKTTIGTAGVANGNGLRVASSRVTVNKAVAAVDCADTACSPTVTQILDASIFKAAASVNRAFTLPTAQGASGIVQGLPGTPAVGDVFTFYISNSGASTVTVTAGTGSTIEGNAVVAAASSKLVHCRVTGVTGGSETITCY